MSKIRTEEGVTVQLLDANEENKCRKIRQKNPYVDALGAGRILVTDKKKAARNSTSRLMQAYKRKTGGK